MGGMKKGPKKLQDYMGKMGTEMEAMMEGEVGRRRTFGGVQVPLKDKKAPKKGRKAK